MRPGVPWNVKGIEAEAREVAQQAARRAGVSLGEYLSGLILTEGRAAPGGAYPQQQGDGTYGPQPQYRPPAGAAVLRAAAGAPLSAGGRAFLSRAELSAAVLWSGGCG
jgi:hypothetical protein